MSLGKIVITSCLSMLLVVCFQTTSYSQTCEIKNDAFFQSTYIKPVSIVEKGNGHYFIDFGKDAFGTLMIQMKSFQSDSLVVYLGEKLKDNTTIDQSPGGTIRYQKVVLKEIPVDENLKLSLAPDYRNTHSPAVTLPDSFGVVVPFRYCEIENLKIPINDLRITQKVYNFRFNDSSSDFSSSDTVLNRIWELCKHTIKATSFAGYYIDGDRERIPYEADALINQLSHYCVDNDYTLAKRTNEYFINHPTWPTEWILQTALLYYYDYLYTGDISMINKYYNELKSKTLVDLERNDGLISTSSSQNTQDFRQKIGFSAPNSYIRDIVDWPVSERDGYDMVKINTVVNSFYYINLKIMSVLAGAINNKNDSIAYQKKADIVMNSINKILYNPSTGLYIDGENSQHSSLHANVFPLVFGIVPKERIPKVLDFIKSRGMACSVYGAQYLLESLYQNNEADYALKLMNDTVGDRNWWNMIETGSTMTLEAWNQKYKPNLDWNHAWGTAPANIITRFLWGISPLTPGFASVIVKPQMSTLTSSSIKVPTIKGTITAEYKQLNNRKKSYTIDLPFGMNGRFEVVGDYKRISNNKKKLNSKEGSILLKSGVNRIVVEYN